MATPPILQRSQGAIRPVLSRQFLGFVGVGLTAALLHWLARILLGIWIVFPVAVVLAYGVGIASAFVLNRMFVFPNSSRPLGEQIRSFVFINLAFFPVVWIAAMALDRYALPFVGVVRYREAIAHAIAISIPMLATFLFYKYVTFRTKDAD